MRGAAIARGIAAASLSLALLGCDLGEERHEHDAPPPSPLFAPELASLDIERAEQGGQSERIVALDAAQFAQAMDAPGVRVIDVRTPEEFADGAIAGAVNIPVDRFDPASFLNEGNPGPVLLYCRSGRRSAIAARQLAQHTGEPALHLAGGILAWQAADYPVIQP